MLVPGGMCKGSLLKLQMRSVIMLVEGLKSGPKNVSGITRL